jgi:nucleotide-binding universal stress UspA family protein
MLKHLLVTLDGTPRAEAVVPPAAEIARATCGALTLLRVIDSVHSEWSERGALGRQSGAAALDPASVEQARDYLERVAAPLRGRGIDVHTVVKSGTRARQIVATAREVGADAIAMAAPSRGGLHRMMFGSVADEVLRVCDLPVLLMRG